MDWGGVDWGVGMGEVRIRRDYLSGAGHSRFTARVRTHLLLPPSSSTFPQHPSLDSRSSVGWDVWDGI